MSGSALPVAQVFKTYLPSTQNWIYEQFRALRDFTPLVLTQKTANLGIFPVERIVVARSGGPMRRARDGLSRRLLGYDPKFAAALRAQRALLIHAHFGGRGVASVELSRVLGVPLLVSFYGFDMWRDGGDSSRLRARYARLFEHCSYAIAEGPVARSRLLELGCPEAKARIHPLGVDLNELPYSERPNRGSVRVLLAARFTEKKGVVYAVEAFCRAASREPGLQLTLVGDADESQAQQRVKSELQRMVKLAQLDGRIRFAGELPPSELRRLLYEHDVLLQPSVRAADGDAEGGFPVILSEAAASGMPLIGTRHCDIPEIVVERKTGWLCEERNVAKLEAALIEAAREPGKRSKFGSGARQQVEARFDINQHTLDSLYRDALANAGFSS